jgi:hypothetical protein
MLSKFSKIFYKSPEDPEAQLKDNDTPETKEHEMPWSPALFWESVVRAEAPMTNPATAETYGSGFVGVPLMALDNYFRVTDRGGTLTKELVGKESH